MDIETGQVVDIVDAAEKRAEVEAEKIADDVVHAERAFLTDDVSQLHQRIYRARWIHNFVHTQAVKLRQHILDFDAAQQSDANEVDPVQVHLKPGIPHPLKAESNETTTTLSRTIVARRNYQGATVALRSRSSSVIRQAIKDTNVCEICNSGENEAGNPILKCACGVTVHKACYGVEFSRTGYSSWECKPCQDRVPYQRRRCELCDHVGGALKPVLVDENEPFTLQRWTHVLCALWQRDISFVDPTRMEPVQGVVQCVAKPLDSPCYLCNKYVGGVIQCIFKGCKTKFHSTCARKHNLRLSVQFSESRRELQWVALCKYHSKAPMKSCDWSRATTNLH